MCVFEINDRFYKTLLNTSPGFKNRQNSIELSNEKTLTHFIFFCVTTELVKHRLLNLFYKILPQDQPAEEVIIMLQSVSQ